MNQSDSIRPALVLLWHLRALTAEERRRMGSWEELGLCQASFGSMRLAGTWLRPEWGFPFIPSFPEVNATQFGASLTGPWCRKGKQRHWPGCPPWDKGVLSWTCSFQGRTW